MAALACPQGQEKNRKVVGIVVLKSSGKKSPFQGIFDPHSAQSYKQIISLYESILQESFPVFIIEASGHLMTQEMCNEAVRMGAYSLLYIPDWSKVQEMCNEVVRNKPFLLEFVQDHFKTKKMCKEAVEEGPQSLVYVPNRYKMQKLWNKAVDIGPLSLELVPDQYKTREMCDQAVACSPYTLGYVPIGL